MEPRNNYELLMKQSVTSDGLTFAENVMICQHTILCFVEE